MEGDFPANVLPAGSAVEAPAATTQQPITNDPSSDDSSQDEDDASSDENGDEDDDSSEEEKWIESLNLHILSGYLITLSQEHVISSRFNKQ